MTKKKWKKLDKIYPILIEIVKKTNRHPTAKEIKDILNSSYNINIARETCVNYLKELEKASHINCIKIKNYRFWTMKGVKKEDETKSEPE